MIASWSLVLGLTAWSFGRILRDGRASDGEKTAPEEADPADRR